VALYNDDFQAVALLLDRLAGRLAQ